jgi:hypothetical protein
MKIIKEKKRKKKKREHGREVLHNISEKPRIKRRETQLPVAEARTQGNPLRGHAITSGSCQGRFR